MNDPCSNFKFDRAEEVGWFGKVWNHWLNPFGNFHEPLPYPRKRHDQWKESVWRFFPESLWWSFRNPLHNLNHFWLGITPLGERYEWIKPECRGWEQSLWTSKDGKWMIRTWRKKGHLPRHQIKFEGKVWNGYFGYMDRGNLGAAFRK